MVGVVDDQRLGDHAAHGDAHDVGLGDAELCEQAGGVVRHVLDRVGRRRRVPREEGHDVGHPLPLGRQATVPVVEADDEVATVAQARDEALGPRDELRAEAHDEEQRRVGGITLQHVLDVDSVDVGGGHEQAPFVVASPAFLPGARVPSPDDGDQADGEAGTTEARCRARCRRGPGASPIRTTSTVPTTTMKAGKAASSKLHWVMVSRTMPMLITAPI